MKRVNALQLRQSMGKVIAQLQETGEPIILQKGRRDVAALITLRDFEERFSEKAAGNELDQIVAEIEAIARPAANGMSVADFLRRMRYGDEA